MLRKILLLVAPGILLSLARLRHNGTPWAMRSSPIRPLTGNIPIFSPRVMSAATDGQFVKSPLWLVIALIFSYSFTRGKTGKPRKTDAAEEEQDRIKN